MHRTKSLNIAHTMHCLEDVLSQTKLFFSPSVLKGTRWRVWIQIREKKGGTKPNK